MKFHGLFLFSASVTKLRLTFGQKSQEKKRQAIRLTSKDAKTRPTTKISYCFRLGFCVSNFLSIISDFLSREKLITEKLSQKLSNCKCIQKYLFGTWGAFTNYVCIFWHLTTYVPPLHFLCSKRSIFWEGGNYFLFFFFEKQ